MVPSLLAPPPSYGRNRDGRTASCLLALAVGSLPLCLQAGRGRYAALLWYLLNPLFCEWVRAYRGKVLFPQLGVYSVGLFSCLCVFLFYVAF